MTAERALEIVKREFGTARLVGEEEDAYVFDCAEKKFDDAQFAVYKETGRIANYSEYIMDKIREN